MASDNQFTRKVATYIAKRDLLKPSGRYLVTLSGGADSVALLSAMLALGYHVEAAHCNFHLRGEESDRDEQFSKDLCRAKGVALHIARFDTLAYANLHKVSVEMAARELRYNYFYQLKRDLRLDGICVAHHKNDSVETLLLNLVRGTGIEGLKGIVPKSGDILRPLLCVNRCEIIGYLASIKQDYITDSSNLVADVQRNKIRLNILPLLRQLNPAVEENISHTAERVEASIQLLREAVEVAKKRIAEDTKTGLRVSIPRLLQETSPEIILWELLRDKGFSSHQVEQIFGNTSAQTGREWFSSTHTLTIDRGFILVEPASEAEKKPLTIPETGIYLYDEGCRFSVKTQLVDATWEVRKTADSVSLDADKIAFPLTIRTIRKGDSFIPFGMSGRKLLSDFLTDHKLSLPDKRRQLVVTDANEQIIWVVGLRTDNRFRISGATKRALMISRTSV